MRADNGDFVHTANFDSMLEKSLPELPPNDVVNQVTPWHRSMHRILVGIALGTLTVNYRGLNYILPAIGVILMLLGFRTLRKENIWLKSCWLITLIRMGHIMFWLMWNATIIKEDIPQISESLPVFNLIWNLLLFFCFWRGLRAVQKKAGLFARTDGAMALFVWQAVVCLLLWFQSNGLIVLPIVVLILLIAYCFILHSLFKISKEVENTGYAIQTALIWTPDWAVAASILVFFAVGMTGAYLFYSQYPMDWQEVKVSKDAKIREIKTHLESLGFPREILGDLTEEDIKACEGAEKVFVETEDYPANEGRMERIETAQGTYQHYQVYDVKELRLTDIAVKLPGEGERWKVFHHFRWTENSGFYGTECLQLKEAFQRNGWKMTSTVTGQVLYNRGRDAYVAPYYFLGGKSYNSFGLFWVEETFEDVFAAFSLPKEGENHRGYLSYTVESEEKFDLLSVLINYSHQKTWMQYPVKSAMESCMTEGWSHGAFLSVQDTLLFYPDLEEEP